MGPVSGGDRHDRRNLGLMPGPAGAWGQLCCGRADQGHSRSQGAGRPPHSDGGVEAGPLGTNPALPGCPCGPTRDRHGPGVPRDEVPRGQTGRGAGGEI